MSKGVYYFIIALGLLGVLSVMVLFFNEVEHNLGASSLMLFNGIALAGVGYINLKKKGI
ncbi:hypothetical protein N8371_03950 [Vicingaceae bacterium]|nr:hypothetical protein [Vicingaceae bacterium]MDC1451549.1 hypothetical protein [Vicingaceae bacterium]